MTNKKRFDFRKYLQTIIFFFKKNSATRLGILIGCFKLRNSVFIGTTNLPSPCSINGDATTYSTAVENHGHISIL